ncbi:3-oxoacyl-[acyl-carrier protein] reductase [Saccharopolyspora gloriosae]|uniref:3-oxoacyl-[acyl-carrier protein] reductase n=1 Tax=Saccharopolyspora gloriosae TaxID=455344 RepID=A0A840NI92_9PSEU|nr:glucose 1-dehydrogenase [Saccharopolyspora gloriosae]MBB5067987.1 3-oxoacyl-[acyl-carrier protein] reductase [Saccharopolyspora gloriosae]
MTLNNSNRLQGKVALVTGAAKGIGAGIAKEFAAAGASVVVNYASDAEGAQKVVSHIRDSGGTAVAVQGDVSAREDVERVFGEVVHTYGRLDVVVNNAAVYFAEPVEDASQEHISHQLSVNVLGPILTVQEALKHFGPDGGSIINIGSLDSARAVPGMSVYAATKGAVDAFTRVLAAELGPRGVRVNTLAPGGVETEGIHAAGFMGSDAEKEMIERTPLGRMGQPQDLARVAVFFASDDAAWVTGERLTASGGLRS